MEYFILLGFVMSRSLLIYYFFLLVIILFSINGSLLGERNNSKDYEKCENPEYLFPWGNDYMNACLSFQCHKVREHKSWYRFWNRKPKYIHKNINGNEQVIQCSDCEGFLKKGTLFGGMSLCTPIEFGGNLEIPKGWISIATANLRLNREIKNKSSIKLIPENWRIDGKTAKSNLDLSKCSISEEDSAVALSILVTLSNISSPSKKLPKYRGILGLSDDSINVRIKTLTVNMEKPVDSLEDDLDDDEFDDEYESEDFQQSMIHDDGSNEYFLYDMNKMVSTHHRIPRDSSNIKTNKKKPSPKKRKPFTGAEKLPRKWKLSKGQTSIYSSSDIVSLDLASNLHPNELVQVILTCNNRYMNCNIQDFVSCFNIICKSVTKEELIHRAALKKAKQFISNSIITGRTKPIMNYNGMQFQPNSPPINAGPMNIQFHHPNINNIVSTNSLQTNSISNTQKAVLGRENTKIQSMTGSGMVDYREALTEVKGQPTTYTQKTNFPVPRMVFVNNGTKNVNINPNIANPGLFNVFVPQPVNIPTSQNVIIPKGLQVNIIPNQTQANTNYQGLNNFVSVNATVAKPQIQINQKKDPRIHKVIILRGKSVLNNNPSQSQTKQCISKLKINQVGANEPINLPKNTNCTEDLNCDTKQTPAKYKLVLKSEPSIATTQAPHPGNKLVIHVKNLNQLMNSLGQPHITNIQQEQPPVLKPIKTTASNPKTIRLNIEQTNDSSVPIRVKFINAKKPVKTKNVFKIVPEFNQVKKDERPESNVLLKSSSNIESEKANYIDFHNILKLVKVPDTPRPKVEENLIKEVPIKASKTFKLVGTKPNKTIEIRAKKINDEKPKKVVFNLVPINYSSKSNTSVFNSNNKGSSTGQKKYKIKTPDFSSGTEVVIGNHLIAKPYKKNTNKNIQPDSNKGDYILKKTLAQKLAEYARHSNDMPTKHHSDSFVEYEFETDDSESFSEDEFSTLILKKVSKDQDLNKPDRLLKVDSDHLVTSKTLKQKTNKYDTNTKERTDFKNEKIEKPESGVEIENSSLSDSSVYENNNRYSNHNEAITGKYILGYSILISVFLFTIFIMIKLCLL